LYVFFAFFCQFVRWRTLKLRCSLWGAVGGGSGVLLTLPLLEAYDPRK